MKSKAYSVFDIFLIITAICAMLFLGIRGWNYYSTPLEQRPFDPGYAVMKPSGIYSHGLGIIGSLMISIGVATYSTRKRVRALHSIGRLSRWLEFHILLCVLGPIFVIYHTTFKVGGIAAITFWSMIAVAASGVVGRFIYALIPRNLNGTALTLDEITNEMHTAGKDLQQTQLGKSIVEMIDRSFGVLAKPRTLLQTVNAIVMLERIKFRTSRSIKKIIAREHLPSQSARQVRETASVRASLQQKSLILEQVGRLFFFWHAVHLPFSIIMFVTLVMHVVVVVLLGYRWIF